MNLHHFAAIVRMRWQTTHNQFQRSSQTNRVITLILLVIAALGSAGSFVFALGWGAFFLSQLAPIHVIYVWDVIAGAFLFFWVISLMVELQRTELLSLRNLLHLPVSLSGAFFLNYLSSLASLSVLLFLPAMLGLCAASVLQFGLRSAVSFVLLIAFLLMVTSVTYQLRGWLARLMENKRTRGTVVAITTMAFIVLFQIPNVLHLGMMNSRKDQRRVFTAEHAQRLEALKQQLKSREIDPERYREATQQADERLARRLLEDRDANSAQLLKTVSLVNAILPIGWLALGASSAAQGHLGVPWLCVLGMSAIGCGSLTMAYRATLREYTGSANKKRRRVSQRAASSAASHTYLDGKLPWLDDTQSVIALATFRSMLRAPESKMALMTPLIFAFVFGSMMLSGGLDDIPDVARPWFGVAALGISLMGMVQVLLNLFGLDRQGFRAYVLMPAPRGDILLGKNLGILPIACVLSALLILFMGVAGRMHFTHTVATLLQIAVVFFLYLPVSNFVSIMAPLGLASGTLKPVSMNLRVVLIQMLAVLLVPIALIPATVALGAEQLTTLLAGARMPVYLLLTLLELPLAIWCYAKLLGTLGKLLEDKEQGILEAVTQVAH